MLASLGSCFNDGQMRIVRGRYLYKIHFWVCHDLQEIVRRDFKVKGFLRLQGPLLPHVAHPLEYHVRMRAHIGQILRVRKFATAYLR